MRTIYKYIDGEIAWPRRLDFFMADNRRVWIVHYDFSNISVHLCAEQRVSHTELISSWKNYVMTNTKSPVKLLIIDRFCTPLLQKINNNEFTVLTQNRSPYCLKAIRC